ncbi:MAG: Cytochrome c oxidase assembly protein cox15 [Piccolia ochrophora]|nr:MAG: Cytochrome c oxidase assembly protein cox15 [Piccolia ochrophora]
MASIYHSWPTLARAAPRLSRRFFDCHHCIRKTPQSPSTPSLSRLILKSSALRGLKGPRFYSANAATVKPTISPLGSLSKTIIPKISGGYFPKTNSNAVAYWLLGSAASVYGIVVFGGLTRLTESGLSITEWRPVTGSIPPLSDADWDYEFQRYQASPEFKQLNSAMTLSEFKYIYYMEWTHRLWGRVVGLSFLLPATYFIARRRVTASMAAKITGIAGLIGFQGIIGWWMVKSGLKDDLFAPGSHPRVSQYRLTAHLGTAFLCYTAMLWNGLSILRENRLLRNPSAAVEQLSLLRSAPFTPLRRSVGALACLVFITAMSGGLVAGLDAGLIYNEFPYMGLGLTPPKSELFSDFYSRRPDGSDIWWRNMLENPSTVQLDHRILATSTFTAVVALWTYTRFSPALRRAALPLPVRRGVLGVVHLVSLQVLLGLGTLLYLVPVPLAAAHQAGSLALLSGVILLGSRVWVPRRLVRSVAEAAKSRARYPAAKTAAPGGQAWSTTLTRAMPRGGQGVGKINSS